MTIITNRLTLTAKANPHKVVISQFMNGVFVGGFEFGPTGGSFNAMDGVYYKVDATGNIEVDVERYVTEAVQRKKEVYTSHFNNLTPTTQELFALLSEEAGEIVGAVGKTLRHGLHSTHPHGTETNIEFVSREVGDLLGVVDALLAKGLLDQNIISKNRWDKMNRAKPYLHHQE